MTLDQALNLTLKRLGNGQTRLLKTIAIDVKNDALYNFDRQWFDRVKWPPKKKPNGKKILIDTGKLKQDVRDSVKNGYQNSPTQFTLEVVTPYAGYHQDGTDRMPQRQFIGMTDKLEKQIVADITKLIDKAFKV